MNGVCDRVAFRGTCQMSLADAFLSENTDHILEINCQEIFGGAALLATAWEKHFFYFQYRIIISWAMAYVALPNPQRNFKCEQLIAAIRVAVPFSSFIFFVFICRLYLIYILSFCHILIPPVPVCPTCSCLRWNIQMTFASFFIFCRPSINVWI